MDTRRIAQEYRLSRWAEIIKERGEKGVTVKAYCYSLGISENTYYYWLKRIREATCDRLVEIKDKTNAITTPVFAEVRLHERPTMPEGELRNQISIESVGVRITADGGYPGDKLTELLRVVMRTC